MLEITYFQLLEITHCQLGFFYECLYILVHLISIRHSHLIAQIFEKTIDIIDF